MEQFPKELIKAGDALPNRLNADPKDAGHGLAKLVLTLIELLRRLMEKQAIRRMEAGSLTEEEIERMGQTFKKLEDKMAELKKIFGFTDEDLNLDLGPLGELM
ncbi:gas vesicle protein K [Candidatus Parcubacteria bacterium]|nr:gas vesicle protein K [Candidatus Parcubacteria bacterium]